MGLEECIAEVIGVFDGDRAKATVLCDKFLGYDMDIATVTASLNDAVVGLNTLYLMTCGSLVFVMHAGFAMVSAVLATS